MPMSICTMKGLNTNVTTDMSNMVRIQLLAIQMGNGGTLYQSVDVSSVICIKYLLSSLIEKRCSYVATKFLIVRMLCGKINTITHTFGLNSKGTSTPYTI